MQQDLTLTQTIGALSIMGLLIGLGKLLASSEKLTWRLVFGRSLVSAGLAVAAGSLIAFIPGLNQTALLGLAAASAVLGEQFLEKILHTKTST